MLIILLMGMIGSITFIKYNTMATEFQTMSLEAFNKLCGTDIQATNTFYEVIDKVERGHNSYFYVSMCEDDVLQAIEDEREVAESLKINLIFVNDIGALYCFV